MKKRIKKAAEAYAELLPINDEIQKDSAKLDFIAGAKWQRQQTLKKVEVAKILVIGLGCFALASFMAAFAAVGTFLRWDWTAFFIYLSIFGGWIPFKVVYTILEELEE